MEEPGTPNEAETWRAAEAPCLCPLPCPVPSSARQGPELAQLLGLPLGLPPFAATPGLLALPGLWCIPIFFSDHLSPLQSCNRISHILSSVLLSLQVRLQVSGFLPCLDGGGSGWGGGELLLRREQAVVEGAMSKGYRERTASQHPEIPDWTTGHVPWLQEHQGSQDHQQDRQDPGESRWMRREVNASSDLQSEPPPHLTLLPSSILISLHIHCG